MLYYTVIGFYADNNQPFVATVRSASIAGAERSAVEEMLDINGWDESYASDVRIVAVLAEKCEVVKKSWEIQNGLEILSGVETTHCEIMECVG